MPTTTFTAASMRYYDSSWHSGQARQGVYGSTNCRGEITFDFASKLDVSNIDISQIVLTVTAGALGGDYTKYLYLKTGGWDGSAVDDLSFSGFYDTTKSKTLSADSYSTAFSRLKAYIEGGGTVLGLYAASSRGKSSGKQYDYDYCSVTAMSLEVTYTYKKSTGVIGSASTGSAAKLTIRAGSSSYKHKVTWSLGGNTYGPVTINAGVTSASYTIPHSWLPNAASGTATVTLETLNGNTSLGSNSYRFTVSVPASVKPAIPSGSVTAEPVYLSGVSSTAQGWGLYIQNRSKAKITVDRSQVTAGDGATVKSYAVSCAGVGSGTSYTYTSPTLTKSGSLTFTATVTDSRGRTASRSVTIAVQEYAAPRFASNPTVYRCNSAGTKQETTGAWARVLASFSCSSVNGRNSLTVHRVSLNGVNTTLTSGTAAVIGAGNLALDSAYTAVITLTDAVGGTTTYSLDIPSAAYLMHFKKGGKSLGIGRAAGEGNDRTVHVGWDVELDAGHAVKIVGEGQSSAFVVQSPDGTKKVSLVVSGSSLRRGLYDAVNGDWVIYTYDDNASHIGRPLWVDGAVYGRALHCRASSSGAHAYLYMRDHSDGVTGYALVSDGVHRWFFYSRPTDYDADSRPYSEYYRLPTPDTGLSANAGYDILTNKSPVTVAQGGTGATTASGARQNLGIQSGLVNTNTYSIPAGGYVDIPVTFPKAFASTPRVVVGFISDSTAGAFGSCSCCVLRNTPSTTGFTIRAFNAGSSARTPGYNWIAIVP